MKALLFINGEFPKEIPTTDGYAIIACTDGALHQLIALNFPLDLLDIIAGDFDSHHGNHIDIQEEKFIYTPNQDKTDFHKILSILQDKGVGKVDIYGGSGGEMDHFLGNLSTAYHFKDRLDMTFYDSFQRYFFISKKYTLKNCKDKMLSLYPFPYAENVSTKGLHWELNEDDLSVDGLISTRNYADTDEVTITYEKGAILLFVGANYL